MSAKRGAETKAETYGQGKVGWEEVHKKLGLETSVRAVSGEELSPGRNKLEMWRGLGMTPEVKGQDIGYNTRGQGI